MSDSKPTPVDAKTIAEAAKHFIGTDAGKAFMAAMQAKYNELHQLAEEDGLLAEERANMIVKASGVKVGMAWFLERSSNVDAGVYEKK